MKPKQDWNLKRNQKQHCIFSTNTCIYLFQCFPSLKNAVWITQVNILKPFQFSGFIKGVPPPPFRFFALQVGLLDNIQDTMWSNPAALGGY